MRYLLTILTLALMPMLSFAAPGYTVKIDTQQTDPEFRIRTIKRGETPTIKAKLYENGTIYTNLSGWGSTFAIYTNSTSTSIWSFPHTTIAANVVTYDLDAIGLPEGRYRAEFIFTNATRTVSFGKIGRVWVEESAGIGSSVTNVLTTPINFDLFTESGTIDGATLTNITLTGLSAVLNDLSDVNSVDTPTVGHVLAYRTAGWTNEATASADTRLDNTTATNAVNMGDFDIDAAGNISVGGGDKITIGSPTNTFAAFPIHIQAQTYAIDLSTNHIDAGISSGTVYAGLLLNGEDSIVQIVSKDEGGHGSTILQQEINADGTFSHQWIQGAGAKTVSANNFYIGQSWTKDYDIAITSSPFYMTTGGTVVVGGSILGGVENGGLQCKGVLRVQDWADDVADSGRIRLVNAESITWESSPASSSEPSLAMSATEALELVNVSGITLGSAVLSEAELEILDGATITTAETDTLSDGSNADSLHVHHSAGISADPVFVGTVAIGDGTTASGILQIDEDDDAGSNFASFQVPALAANTVYTLPPDDGDASEVLQTDGAGVMTWVANTGGDSVSIDGVGVVDPDFVSTGDIDFIDTSNTITADINSGADYTSDNVTISNLTVQTSLLGISTFTLSVSQLVANVIDTVGAADMDYGSADVTDHTFTTDGGTVILDGTIDPSGAILLDATAGMSDGANSFFDFGGTAAGGDLSVSLGDNDIAGSGLQIEILATSEAIELKNTAQTAQVSVWGDLDADIITADEVVNIENADTTIARDSAGVLSVEGNVIHHTGGLDITDADISDTLTIGGTSTVDGELITDNTIDEDSIDWGTGTDQISAVDVPIGDTGAIFTATEVEATLLELAKVPVNTKSGAYTIGTDDARECYGGVITVTAAATITGPATLVTGMSWTIKANVAGAVVFDPNVADTITLDGTATTAGDSVTSTSTLGDIAVFVAMSASAIDCTSNDWTDTN